MVYCRHVIKIPLGQRVLIAKKPKRMSSLTSRDQIFNHYLFKFSVRASERLAGSQGGTAASWAGAPPTSSARQVQRWQPASTEESRHQASPWWWGRSRSLARHRGGSGCRPALLWHCAGRDARPRAELKWAPGALGQGCGWGPRWGGSGPLIPITVLMYKCPDTFDR